MLFLLQWISSFCLVECMYICVWCTGGPWRPFTGAFVSRCPPGSCFYCCDGVKLRENIICVTLFNAPENPDSHTCFSHYSQCFVWFPVKRRQRVKFPSVPTVKVCPVRAHYILCNRFFYPVKHIFNTFSPRRRCCIETGVLCVCPCLTVPRTIWSRPLQSVCLHIVQWTGGRRHRCSRWNVHKLRCFYRTGELTHQVSVNLPHLVVSIPQCSLVCDLFVSESNQRVCVRLKLTIWSKWLGSFHRL